MSADPPETLRKWAAKKEFPYPLLGDEGHAVLEAWGVWGEKKFMGRSFLGVTRATFLVGPTGKIVRAWPKASPPGHAKEVLQALEGRKG